jgi:hypothetical protein
LANKANKQARDRLKRYNSDHQCNLDVEQLCIGIEPINCQALRGVVDSYCKVIRMKEEIELLDNELLRIEQHVVQDVKSLRALYTNTFGNNRLMKPMVEQELALLRNLYDFEHQEETGDNENESDGVFENITDDNDEDEDLSFLLLDNDDVDGVDA